MTRKEKNALLKEKQDLLNMVNTMLIQALGLEVRNGYVCEQGLEKAKYKFRNKFVRFFNDNATTNILPYNSQNIIFDPINIPKLCQEIFARFLHKEELENGVETTVFFIKDKSFPYVLCLETKNPDGTIQPMESEPFYNQNLAYIDMICGMSGLWICDELKKLDLIYTIEQDIKL